jgi:hypothetical protein
MQDFVLFYLPLTPLLSIASYSIGPTYLVQAVCCAEDIGCCETSISAGARGTPALPFNTSLNPTAYSAALMREASALQRLVAAG